MATAHIDTLRERLALAAWELLDAHCPGRSGTCFLLDGNGRVLETFAKIPAADLAMAHVMPAPSDDHEHLARLADDGNPHFDS